MTSALQRQPQENLMALVFSAVDSVASMRLSMLLCFSYVVKRTSLLPVLPVSLRLRSKREREREKGDGSQAKRSTLLGVAGPALINDLSCSV